MPKVEVVATRIELEETFLSNADPRTKKFPEGRKVEYWLFCSTIETRQLKGGLHEYTKRFIHDISAATEDEANERLAEFADRPDVTVVDTRTPAGIRKLKERVA